MLSFIFKTSDPELWTFASLNLALVYLRTNRQSELMAILETIEPERMTTTLVYYV